MTSDDTLRQERSKKPRRSFETPSQIYQQEIARELVLAYRARTGRGAERIATDVYLAGDGEFSIVSRQAIGNWLSGRNYLEPDSFKGVWNLVNHPNFLTVVNEGKALIANSERAISVGLKIAQLKDYPTTGGTIANVKGAWSSDPFVMPAEPSKNPWMSYVFIVELPGYSFGLRHDLMAQTSSPDGKIFWEDRYLTSGYIFSLGNDLYRSFTWHRTNLNYVYGLGDDSEYDSPSHFTGEGMYTRGGDICVSIDPYLTVSIEEFFEQIKWNIVVSSKYLENIKERG